MMVVTSNVCVQVSGIIRAVMELRSSQRMLGFARLDLKFVYAEHYYSPEHSVPVHKVCTP